MKSRNTKTPPKANRVRRVKRSNGAATALTEAEEKAHAAHVAKLVKQGWVKLGKEGPLPAELFRPGPRAPGIQKALRWARDDA